MGIEVSVEKPVPTREQHRFRWFIRRWWMVSAGLLSVLGFAAALLTTTDWIPIEPLYGALFLIPGTILFGVIAYRHFLRRRWSRGAVHTITTIGLLIMGIWIWDAYGVDSVEAWGIVLVIPVIPATVWLVIDVIRAGKEPD